MSVDNNDPIFTSISFLTGTTIASLFFLMQSNLSHNFILLSSLGISSMLFLVSTIGRLNIVTGKIPKNTQFSYAVSWMVIAGLLLLLFSLLELVFNFNPLSGILTLFALGGGYAILEKLERKYKNEQRGNSNPES